MDGKEKVNQVIAIDGPSGSGKSTLARNLSRALGFLHVDSGAMYRAVAWKALQSKVRGDDAAALAALVGRIAMRFSVRDGAVIFTIDGMEPGNELRTRTVTGLVSPVSAVPEVREKVTHWLRSMRDLGNLVMEGRDIGTVVFPDATHKFYLVCDSVERASRRHVQYAALKENLSVTDVHDSLRERDRIDSGRTTAPLRQAADAVAIDNSALKPEETLALALNRVRLPE